MLFAGPVQIDIPLGFLVAAMVVAVASAAVPSLALGAVAVSRAFPGSGRSARFAGALASTFATAITLLPAWALLARLQVEPPTIFAACHIPSAAAVVAAGLSAERARRAGAGEGAADRRSPRRARPATSPRGGPGGA